VNLSQNHTTAGIDKVSLVGEERLPPPVSPRPPLLRRVSGTESNTSAP